MAAAASVIPFVAQLLVDVAKWNHGSDIVVLSDKHAKGMTL